MSLYTSCGQYIWLASLSLQTAIAYCKWSQEALQIADTISHSFQALATYYTMMQTATFVIGVSCFLNGLT
jgi:hypothetical protein